MCDKCRQQDQDPDEKARESAFRVKCVCLLGDSILGAGAQNDRVHHYRASKDAAAMIEIGVHGLLVLAVPGPSDEDFQQAVERVQVILDIIKTSAIRQVREAVHLAKKTVDEAMKGQSQEEVERPKAAPMAARLWDWTPNNDKTH